MVLSGWVCFHAGLTTSDMAMLRRACGHVNVELCVVQCVSLCVCVCVCFCLFVYLCFICVSILKF